MPSVSESQKRFMVAAAHNPEFAKKAGIKQSTAKEWNGKDKGSTKKLPEKVSKESQGFSSSRIGVGNFKDQ